jgi:hypothetical protein
VLKAKSYDIWDALGSEAEYNVGWRLGVEWCYPRHCFIKGYQVDALNRKIVTAVPVPAYQVRELEPECDLLDFDPECEWVGGMPGRLHGF